MERERPIRRIFCWAGYSFLAGAFAASFLGLTVDLAAAATALFLSAIFRFVWRQPRACAVSLSLAAAFLWVAGYLGLFYYPLRSLAGKEAAFTGVVEEAGSDSGRTRFTVGTRSIEARGAPQGIRVRVSGYGDYDVEPGDLIGGGSCFSVRRRAAPSRKAEARLPSARRSGPSASRPTPPSPGSRLSSRKML